MTAAISPEIVNRIALSLAGCRYAFIWSPLSAIVHADGTMRKTNKAELGHQLEAQVERVSELPQSTTSTMVWDAMAVIQMMGVPIQLI